jgi:hypothetical protein
MGRIERGELAVDQTVNQVSGSGREELGSVLSVIADTGVE